MRVFDLLQKDLWKRHALLLLLSPRVIYAVMGLGCLAFLNLVLRAVYAPPLPLVLEVLVGLTFLGIMLSLMPYLQASGSLLASYVGDGDQLNPQALIVDAYLNMITALIPGNCLFLVSNLADAWRVHEYSEDVVKVQDEARRPQRIQKVVSYAPTSQFGRESGGEVEALEPWAVSWSKLHNNRCVVVRASSGALAFMFLRKVEYCVDATHLAACTRGSWVCLCIPHNVHHWTLRDSTGLTVSLPLRTVHGAPCDKAEALFAALLVRVNQGESIVDQLSSGRIVHKFVAPVLHAVWQSLTARGHVATGSLPELETVCQHVMKEGKPFAQRTINLRLGPLAREIIEFFGLALNPSQISAIMDDVIFSDSLEGVYTVAAR